MTITAKRKGLELNRYNILYVTKLSQYKSEAYSDKIHMVNPRATLNINKIKEMKMLQQKIFI